MATVDAKTLQVDSILDQDPYAVQIANMWMKWNLLRQPKIRQWEEVREYIFAVDTTTTSNAALPWKNKTTLPKITQIRDNLHANYMAALFPKRKWLYWMAENSDSGEAEKTTTIEDYMRYLTDKNEFKVEIARIVQDYIDYGNFFVAAEWVDESDMSSTPTSTKYGYSGPRPVRISPLDIVFNPIASSFEASPKIVRSIIQRGDIVGQLNKNTDMSQEEKEKISSYFDEIRSESATFTELTEKDSYLNVDGFSGFREYLESDYCELLTFYGDIYDTDTNTFLRNRKIVVADRHKIISNVENPSIFANAPIYHGGWRIRQDNLWAMGPLENLVGMQYRVDHIENLKADVFDLNAFPPLKIKGQVEDFEWAPMERIYIGDDGDVIPMPPDASILQANMEIQQLQAQMEEMAGAPKEAAGFRTPGEKTAYEVQRIENAYNRIFNAKTRQFEQTLEKLLNAMLELAKRKMTAQSISIWNDDLKIQTFHDISPADISGTGRIKPLAAQHFAEKSEKIQNLTAFFTSPIGQDPMVRQHFSSVKMAQLAEELLDLEKDDLVQPYVNISEQQEVQRLSQVAQEQTMVESQTPIGVEEDDFDDVAAGAAEVDEGAGDLPAEGELTDGDQAQE